MSEIVEYNCFDNDIRKGDIVVFLDGTQKKIKEIDGHRVAFNDGNKIDLFVTKIKGIIKTRRSEVTPKRPAMLILPNFNDEFFDVPLKKTSKPIMSSENNLSNQTNYVTYDELFTMMESADHSDLNFSKYFWHYTTLSNLVSIIKKKKFLSRYDVEGNIPYDNKEHNLTSKNVMFNNLSWKTKTHVRFYLRPLNKPFFSLYACLPEIEKRNYCLLRIKREALSASFKSTFLYYQTANKATDDVYDKKYELNQKQKESFYMNNLDKFNFEETYSIYDIKQDKKRSLYQEAEFLVWKELSFIFVDKIIFRTNEGLNNFLDIIKAREDYNDIKNKCIVDWKYFGYKD